MLIHGAYLFDKSVQELLLNKLINRSLTMKLHIELPICVSFCCYCYEDYFCFFALVNVHSGIYLTFNLKSPKHITQTSAVSTKPLNLVPKILLHGFKRLNQQFLSGEFSDLFE